MFTSSLSRQPSPGWTWLWGKLCQSMSAGCCSAVSAAAAPWAAPCGRWSVSVRGWDLHSHSPVSVHTLFYPPQTRHQLEKQLDWENCHLYSKLGLRWKLARQRCDSSLMMEHVIMSLTKSKHYFGSFFFSRFYSWNLFQNRICSNQTEERKEEGSIFLHFLLRKKQNIKNLVCLNNSKLKISKEIEIYWKALTIW